MLQVDHRKVDLEEEGIDLAIRCGRGGTPGRVSVQLFEEWCYPVASPALARAIGEGGPERFLDQPLIHDSDAAGWRAWFNAQGLDFRPRATDRRFEDYNLVLDAAASGLGVALSRPPLAQAQVDAGRIVRVDQRTALNPVSYWLDRPMGQPRPAAVALATRIAHEAGLPAGKLAGFLRTEAKAA